MEKVIVTIQRPDIDFTRDLELSPSAKVRDIVDLVAHAMQWNQSLGDTLYTFEVEAAGLHRKLDPDESLAQAGVWDGSILVFHQVDKGKKPLVFRQPVPGGSKPHGPAQDASTPGSSPLVGWRKTFN